MASIEYQHKTSFDNGRDAQRAARACSEETMDWVYLRKPNWRVEHYTLHAERKDGDRAYCCGRAMPV